MWQHNRTRYSGKFAVDVSHFRVWERIAASNTAGIILEDDVRPTGQTWSRDLLTVLNELPEVRVCVLQQQADLTSLRMHQRWAGLTLQILISASEALAAACSNIQSSQDTPHLPAVPPPTRVTACAGLGCALSSDRVLQQTGPQRQHAPDTCLWHRRGHGIYDDPCICQESPERRVQSAAQYLD